MKLKQFLIKYQTLLSIAILGIIVIVIYQNAYLDYARRDQIFYIIERNSFQNDWSWFTHAIHYNRTRMNAPGDYFLFRPAFFFFLTIYDIFFRDNQLVTGLTSIALHLSAVILIYITLRRYFKETPAFLFAALFASQCVGIEMVVWRHISFYIASSSLALISLLIILSASRHKYLFAGVTLFAAMLFHEIVPVSMVFLMFILILMTLWRGASQSQESIVGPKYVYLLVALLALYFVFDLIDWKITSPPSFIGPADHFTLNWPLVNDAQKNFLEYLGCGTRSVLNPFSMVLTWQKSLYDWAYFAWDIRNGDPRIYFIWAAVAVILLGTTISIIFLRILRRKDTPAEIITLWACCNLLTLTGLFSFFRLTLRNPGYSCFSTYYYWFFSFFYIIVLKFLIDEIFKKLPLTWKKGAYWIGGIFMTVVILGQMFQARDLIDKNYDLKWAKQVRQAIETSQVYFKLHPDTCLDPSEKYLGVPPRNRQFFTLPYYLNKYNCGWVKGKSVVHLYRTNQGVTSIRPGPYPAVAE